MSSVKPVLVANLTDAARDFVEGIALAGRTVIVPVERPPADDSLHELEVRTPNAKEPLRLLARRAGPPTAAGVPLVLEIPSSAPASAAVPKSSKATMAYAGVAPAPPPVPPRAPPASHAVTLQAPPEEEPQLEPVEEGDSDRLIGRELAGGKLVIEALVGQGGAGSVYRARHRDLHMHVAVKVMHESYQQDADFCRRFHTEALSASRLDHPNLTRVLDFGQEPDGLLYLAMEFLDGQSLRDVLEAEQKLAAPRVAKLMIQVCSGLTHAHARNIVHRDIKPENLVLVKGLDDNGKETEIVKVCDFGIAHRPATDGTAVLAGTAEYMAPELFRGEDPDVQSDVYACGVVLYELLTGMMPIPGDFTQIVSRVQVVEPEPPSRHVGGLDARVDRVVMKALTKQKQLRHASVVALRDELRSVMEDIALFSAGGYWNEIEAAPVSIRTSPAAEPTADGPDWLERGPGYLQSMVPTATSSSSPPSSSAPPSQRAPLSASLMPSMRAAAQSYASMGPSGSNHPSSASMPAARPASASSASMPAYRSSSASLPSMPAYRSSAPSQGPADSGLAHPSIVPGSAMGAMVQGSISDGGEDSRQMAAFLQKLLQTTDTERFAAAVPQIDARVRALMADKQAGPLWRLRSTLEIIAGETTPRAAHAKQLLRTLSDRELLAPIADRSLDGLADRDGTARKMIVRAGKNGAYALYGSRLRDAGYEARERFVAILQEMGAPAMSMLRAGLERLESRLSHQGATALAEDLLKALPPVTDEATADLIARYTRVPADSLVLLATTALPKIAGVRARPLLETLIDHKDDAVSIASIRGLRDLDQVDLALVKILEPLVLGELTTRAPPRIAAVEALAKPVPEAVGAARQLLSRALQQTSGTTPDAEDLIVCSATSLLAVGGDATLVAERWRKSTTWLRTRLEAVLRQYQKAGM
jgi:serine/threonine protein kinase